MEQERKHLLKMMQEYPDDFLEEMTLASYLVARKQWIHGFKWGAIASLLIAIVALKLFL